MSTLFNKILGENEKYVFYLYLKPKELFGHSNTVTLGVRISTCEFGGGHKHLVCGNPIPDDTVHFKWIKRLKKK